MAATYASSNGTTHRSSTQPDTSPKPSNAPQGTFLPGTKVQVGSHRVVIERYLSEGGFAHVYVVRIPRDGNKYEIAVLKRVAVPDKKHLTSMRTEVETMKKLKGHQKIVTYIDSHASQLNGGGYEVFLLMEFCQGGGLIDFMNTRLQHRLTEPEILKIFGDVAEGLACMHYLKPPLLHRDLKIENVLISKSGKESAPIYKLADFGSTAPPRPAATTAEEARLIEDDIQQHTTMQYRSPEMIDVWRKKPIDEKSDIWALGVLLYKLCYYTTPFEAAGQMAILNATFKFPQYPQFSSRIRQLISSMLREDPGDRPNVYQVVKEVCSMRGTQVPIKDIYTSRSQSEARANQALPEIRKESPLVGLQKASAEPQQQVLPDIVPMRRGRPTSTQPPPKKVDSSPAKADPFAALDSKNYQVRAGAVDELSKRFPSLDDFAIAHDRHEPFKFNDKTQRTEPKNEVDASLSQRVTNALADEAFASSDSKQGVTDQQRPHGDTERTTVAQRISQVDKALPERKQTARPGYTSTATGTSPPQITKTLPGSSSPSIPKTLPSRPQPEVKLPEQSRSIWRVPTHSRSTSQSRASPDPQAIAASKTPGQSGSKRPALLDIHRSKSQTSTVSMLQDSAKQADDKDQGLLRAQTLQPRSRPNSAYLSSNLDFLRERESARKSSADYKRSIDSNRHSRQPSPRLVATDDGDFAVVGEHNIENDIDFLQSKEGDNADLKRKNSRKGSGGLSFGHRKRNSLPSISGALKGRFGDAFKRFEGGKDEPIKTPSEEPRTPRLEEQESALLSPIAGSDATPTKHSDDTSSAIGDAEELPADVRREMERRRLSQEERRVAEAARQYRERVSTNGTGSVPSSRGTAIQQRVQTLLDEGSRSSSPVKRTAEGYGRFTDAYDSDDSQQSLPPRSSSLSTSTPPIIAKKPTGTGLVHPRPRAVEERTAPRVDTNVNLQRNVPKPSAPPKPRGLQTSQWPPGHPNKPLPPQPSGNLAALLAKDLEGVPDYSQGSKSQDALQQDDVEAEFSRRYPSLSGIQMIETDLGKDGAHQGRVREI